MRDIFKKILISIKYNFIINLLIGVSVFFGSCIEEFDPTLAESNKLVVIDGSIVMNDKIQTVTVSWSTTLKDQLLILISGCEVIVSDTLGNTFNFSEDKDSRYRCSIPQEYLNYGMKYQLYVKLPDGREYQSAKEEILASSPIDSVYYLEEPYQSATDYYENGLQFYADLSAPDAATKNYMWELEETFEINTMYPIDGYWYEKAIWVPWYNPVDSMKVCWSTLPIKETYTSSTKNLTINEKKKIPLNYVPGGSTKLNIKYSLLVKQYALSNAAYEYHNLNNLTTSQNGIYETQPAQSKCNIKNINNPEEDVLGYFWASSYSQKRLFFSGPLGQAYYSHCESIIPCIPEKGQTLMQFFRRIGKSVYLVALEFDNVKKDSVTLWGYPPSQICIDCTAEGGKTQKPDFW